MRARGAGGGDLEDSEGEEGREVDAEDGRQDPAERVEVRVAHLIS